jgi:ribosomal protein S21
MLIVKVGNKKIEQVLKELRRKVERTKQVERLRELKTYKKPSHKKREILTAAKYKQSKYGNQNI